ncbi:MAG: Tripartite tricarboxylate transporter family receptor [Syntrophaceae bacterium PtaU1.Bin231]|nr:MAG: Tripartite tricarboxylate transporter family receptor [Syntrophaceae bacterium PtaU1.Bin231]HOG16862.1 tripartite tricarboxylate transporter substrate binding protein [Syntrophales bacterium]
MQHQFNALKRIITVCAAMGLLIAAPAWAADFPQQGKAIQMLIGYAAGGSTDATCRIMASGLEKALGTSVVPVNKPGASSQIAYTALAQAKPDGYTIGYAGIPSLLVSYLDPARKAAYNGKSFEFLGMNVLDPGLLAVRADSPFKTVKDVIDAAKANPNKIRVSTTGIQSDDAFAVLQLQKITGAQFAQVHFSQGVAEAKTAFLGGKIEVFCANVGDLLPQFKSGAVRILGIMDDEPSPFYPGVKTFAEQGYKLYNSALRGYAAPAGTPKEVVKILSGAIKKAVDSEDHKKRMADMGLTLRYMDSDQFTKTVNEYEGIIKEFLAQMR